MPMNVYITEQNSERKGTHDKLGLAFFYQKMQE